MLKNLGMSLIFANIFYKNKYSKDIKIFSIAELRDLLLYFIVFSQV